MAGMFGDARRAKKDVLADLVSIKHEVQKSIMDASMRKAILAESEKNVKEDMQNIIDKLKYLLKVIHDNARFLASREVTCETEKINDEIIFLEEQFKSLGETEEYVRDKTSNTNLKPLKLGKERFESAKERLDAYKEGISKKSAKFVLHPILTQILEQMESFTMGTTLILSLEQGENEDNDEDDEMPENWKREQSSDPIRTSFIRSNSSKLIKLTNEKDSTPTSRQSSVSGSSTPSKTAVARKKSTSSSSFSTENMIEAVPRKSKLISRSKTSTETIKEVKEDKKDEKINPYRSIAGLRATVAERSVSAPFLNLVSSKNNVFIERKNDETSPMNISYKEALNTRKHVAGCYITGIVALTNETVVLCDSVHDSLQLYDPELQLISEMECPHPWGIAAVSDTAVAVSLHYDHKIILIQAAKSLERINEKDIILKCNASLMYDVKYYAYRIYTLCIEGDIHILDLKGREYGIIKSGMPPNTLKFFDIDIDREHAIISGDKGIFCLNFQGLPLWHYKTHNKSKMVCTGVLVYKECLLICDWENNKLVEIYDDGQRLRTVYSERIEKPVAMCRATNGEAIFVTQGDYEMSDEKARTIHVLQIEMQKK